MLAMRTFSFVSLRLLVGVLFLTRRAVLADESPGLPMVINTWGGAFTAATDAAFEALASASASEDGDAVVDAVVAGCAVCERDRCDGTVGYGGSPDEACETTLDALVMDGSSLDLGAVAGLRRVRDAVAVARRVLRHTRHSLLAGDLATRFAVENGFVEEDLTTPESAAACARWRDEARCQPNFRVGVRPDPSTSCGPYRPDDEPSGGGGVVVASQEQQQQQQQQMQMQMQMQQMPLLRDMRAPPAHDTISMVAIDARGRMAAATSTNGAAHKVPGRVGDGAIAGSGAYVDGEVGGCGATGDGDVMMRLLPCYQAVENLRRGMTPREAAEDVVRRVARRYPAVQAGVVVVDARGRHGGAAAGWTFTYAYRGGAMEAAKVVTVAPLA